MKKFYSKLMALMLVFTFAFSTYAVNAADETGTAGTVTESGDKKDTPDSSGDENGVDTKKDDTTVDDKKDDQGKTDPGKDDGKTDPGKDDGKTDPGKDDGKTDPGKDDGKTDPGKDDGKTDPGKDPGKTDPGKDDGKTDPGKDPGKTDPGKDPGKTDPGKDDGKTDPKPTKTKPDDVTYKAKVDDSVTFSAKDFTAQYKEITNESFSYMQITKLPSSSYGVLYYDYEGRNEAKVRTSSKLTTAFLDKISFVAAKKGSVTIPYTMYGTGKTLTGNIIITISSGSSSSSSATISYTADDDSVKFRSADFKSACSDATGKTLDFVKFTLPSSSKGTLWYDYEGSDEAKVTANRKYYAADTPSLNKVYFVPKSGASGTVSISFTGTTTNEKTFTGTVKIKMSSSSSSSSVIKYTVKSSSEVDFKVRDFEKACTAETDSELTKIVFTSLPSASKGKLYLGYKSSSRYDEIVSEDEDYYVDDDPAISDITFVPKSSASGTVTIKYKGYYSRSKYYDGTVQIKITGSSSRDDDDDDDDDNISTLTLTTNKNKEVSLNASSISSAYKKATGKTLSYIKLSSVSSSYGKLYYDYDSDDEEAVRSSDKYYASKNPYIKNVSFVPAKNYTGTVTLSYTAYASSGTGTDGKIKITVKGSSKDDDDDDNTNGSADVSLGVVKNRSVTFTVSPFNVASISVTDDSVRSIRFGAVNSSYGKLYYNYGTYSQKEVPAAAVFYASGEPYITGVTFVPAKGYTGNVTIPYTGTNNSGKTFSGVVRIAVTSYKKLFSDVTEDKWYYDTVSIVCDANLMRGTSDTTFNPEGSMTVAEAITMGARLYNSIRGGTDVTFTASASGNWFDVYVSFAIKNGIIKADDFSDYTRTATRAEMAYIFYHSVTPAYLSAINSWNSLPDVTIYDKYGSEIYSLYNAGILTGNDSYGTFGPSSEITRAQAAAILGRTGNIIDRIKK